MDDPRKELRRAANDTRLLGVVLALMGALPLLILVNRGDTRSLPARVAAIVNAATLIGPGVWYFIAAGMMLRLHPYVVRTSVRVAVAQMAIVAGCVVLAILGVLGRNIGETFAVPACMAVFQMPALIALLFVFRRAGRLIRLLEPTGHAFEAIPIATVHDPNAQPMDNDREK